MFRLLERKGSCRIHKNTDNKLYKTVHEPLTEERKLLFPMVYIAGINSVDTDNMK